MRRFSIDFICFFCVLVDHIFFQNGKGINVDKNYSTGLNRYVNITYVNKIKNDIFNFQIPLPTKRKVRS